MPKDRQNEQTKHNRNGQTNATNETLRKSTRKEWKRDERRDSEEMREQFKRDDEGHITKVNKQLSENYERKEKANRAKQERKEYERISCNNESQFSSSFFVLFGADGKQIAVFVGFLLFVASPPPLLLCSFAVLIPIMNSTNEWVRMTDLLVGASAMTLEFQCRVATNATQTTRG